MKSKLSGEIKRILWWPVILAALVIVTLMAGPLAPDANCETGIPVTRDLPDTVLPLETFKVTVTFTAPANDFNAIGLSEFAPAGWKVKVNAGWCTPAPMDCLASNNKAEIIWAGPYPAGASFTAVYQVTVPGGAANGCIFNNGVLEYYLGAGVTPYKADITGKSEVEVISVPTSTPGNNAPNGGSPANTPSPQPASTSSPGNANPATGSVAGVDINKIGGSAGEIAEKTPAPQSSPSASQAVPPAPTPAESPLLYPPAARDWYWPIGWPALWGIACGIVVIIGLIFIFKLTRRPY